MKTSYHHIMALIWKGKLFQFSGALVQFIVLIHPATHTRKKQELIQVPNLIICEKRFKNTIEKRK